jgi:ABC-type sugar transport system substrate-binding protein
MQSDSTTRRALLVWFACLVPIFCAVCLSGCKKAKTADEARTGSARAAIAVVGAGRNDPLWPVIKGTAETVRRDLVGLKLIVDAPEIVSFNAQSQLIGQLYDEGVSALCVQVIDPAASRDLLEGLRERGVIVVTMIRPVDSVIPFEHCGWDERAFAERMVDVLINRLPKGGHLVLLASPELISHGDGPDFGTVDSRRSGMVQRYRTLKHALHSFGTLLVLKEYPCDSADSALQAMKRGIDEFPTIDAWVSLENWPLRVEPEQVASLSAGDRQRFLLAADPMMSVCHEFGGDRPVVAVAPEYGEIVPTAIHAAQTLLLRGGPFRSPGTIHLRVVSNRDFESYKRDWASWCGSAPGPPRP